KNEVLIDSVSVEITATDDKGITQVEFIVDNEVAKTWIMSPYIYTWNVTDLSDSSEHSVYARAYDADDNVSTTPVVKVLVMLLSAPTKLSAQTVSDTQILLSWQDNSKIEDGFRIERKEEGGSYVQIAEVGANVTTYDDAGLTYGTNYYYRVRAYTSQNNSIYSNEKSITIVIPAPSDLDATALDDQSVHLTWTDNSAFETGFRIERKEEGGNYSQITEIGANVTSFNDSGLTYGRDYYYQVRAYTSLNNSAYSNEKSVTTIFPAPSNLNATAIDDQSLRLTWTDNCSFEAGYRIERKESSGSYVQIAEVGANVKTYEDAGLTYGTNYYYRARAFTSKNNSVYSNEKSVMMIIPAPTSLNATALDDQSVRLTWTDNCTFETGFRIERKEEGGNYLQITEVGANVTSYNDSGLTYGDTYAYRVRAFTSINQSDYSNEKSFTVGCKDIDGNVYTIIRIGNQWWMAENLKVTHFRNGETIPNVTSNTEWNNSTISAYCNYENNEDYVATYGRLYKWYAVNDSRNIAPQGWHIPSDEEWKELEMYLGMSQSEADKSGVPSGYGEWRGTDEGGKLKESGTVHWESPNTGATNESGFSALPGGFRYHNSPFSNIGKGTIFWSSTEYGSYYAWARVLDCNNSGVYRYTAGKPGGVSVRCVRD
ncbi:MAG: FISUMP domain-containing protein, partial [archaeon]